MADAPSIPAENKRLEELRGGLFTSDLSIDEFVMVRQAGFSPLGMVVGSSIYHVGLQYGNWKQSFELATLTEAMHAARELSLARMVSEAQALGADGVIGTDLVLQAYPGGTHVLEFMAIGTAIKYDASPGALRFQDGQPFTCHVSGQDFVKLWRLGYVPTHFAFGVCVYHVAHQTMRQTMRQMGVNTELPNYTQAVYSAREIALERLQSEAIAWGAEGIVGTRLNVSTHVWGEHGIEFLGLGTGVRRHGIEVPPMQDPIIVASLDR